MKKFTSILMTLFMLMFLISTNVNAATISDNSKDIKENIDFLNTFPDLKKNLDENGYDEFIETKNQYFKVELKNKSLKKEVYDSSDFDFKNITEEEYNAAKITKSLKQSVKGENDDYISQVGGDNYLRLSLSIFRKSSAKHKFSVTHSYEWIRPSFFALRDVIGISVGPIMKITSDSWLSQSAHNVYIADVTSPTGQTAITKVDNNTDIKHNNAGIATEFDLQYATADEFGYIKCEVQFSQNGASLGHQSSNIFGNYIHTQIGFAGGVSVGIDGKPSISTSVIEKEYSYSTNVGYN